MFTHIPNMKQFIRKYFAKIGEIELQISSTEYEFQTLKEVQGELNEITISFTAGEIELREFTLPNPIYTGEYLDNSIAWSLIITAKKDFSSPLEIKCVFKNKVKGSASTGENLDAIQFRADRYELHIGTEDAESMMWRAYQENYMPKRFFELLKNTKENYADKTFTQILKKGLATNFPPLLQGEVIKFHYLIAESKETDLRTWLAVEKSIETIEEIIIQKRQIK